MSVQHSQGTGWATGDYRRAAGGRRRYNTQRRNLARLRQIRILQLLVDRDLMPFARGCGRLLADHFDVSPATISRDLNAIFSRAGRPLHKCPSCGSRSLTLDEQIGLVDALIEGEVAEPW